MKHLKRLISALLLTAAQWAALTALLRSLLGKNPWLGLAGFGALYAGVAMKDVPAKNWAYPYVSKMVDMEIMQTHDGGYFYPDLPTSRGEFVLYLWRAMDAPAIGVDAGFTDVSWDDPWSGAVNWAVGAGIHPL